MNQSFTVVGIFQQSDSGVDESIIIPLQQAEELFNRKDTYNAAVVRLKKGLELEQEAEKIEKRLLRKFEDDEFDIFTPKEIIDEISGFFNVINIVLSGIAAISIVVAGVGIMNTMFTAVLERTSQIGVMKAIGARNRDVLSIFIIEAAFIGLTGGILGVILGLLMAYGLIGLLSSFGFLPLVLSIELKVIGLGVGISMGIGILSGIAPAIRAATMNLIDALRYE